MVPLCGIRRLTGLTTPSHLAVAGRPRRCFGLVPRSPCLPYERSGDRVPAQGTCTPSVHTHVRRTPVSRANAGKPPRYRANALDPAWLHQATSHEPQSPAMTTTSKCVCFVAAVLLVLAIDASFRRSPDRSPRQIAFSCLGVSVSSNVSFISVGITNQSGSTIVYLACPPQVKSHGAWSKFQFPSGMPMATLTAGQSSAVVVTTPSLSEESRVPVLWGFSYSSTATKWQQLREDVIGRLTRRNPRGRGALYTNYVTDLRP